MARSNDYTHGGSAGKNLVLLLRALINIVGFTAFWYGISQLDKNDDVAVMCAVAGGVLMCVGIWFNLLMPAIHSKK